MLSPAELARPSWSHVHQARELCGLASVTHAVLTSPTYLFHALPPQTSMLCLPLPWPPASITHAVFASSMPARLHYPCCACLFHACPPPLPTLRLPLPCLPASIAHAVLASSVPACLHHPCCACLFHACPPPLPMLRLPLPCPPASITHAALASSVPARLHRPCCACLFRAPSPPSPVLCLPLPRLPAAGRDTERRGVPHTFPGVAPPCPQSPPVLHTFSAYMLLGARRPCSTPFAHVYAAWCTQTTEVPMPGTADTMESTAAQVGGPCVHQKATAARPCAGGCLSKGGISLGSSASRSSLGGLSAHGRACQAATGPCPCCCWPWL